MSEIALRKPQRVIGQRLQFRDATIDDAAFILSLRLDAEKGRYLSPTSSDLTEQRRWLSSYAADPSQAYFIIETLDHRLIGTVRLYDVVGGSFSWGSWILAEDAPRSSAVESTMMVYSLGLACGFTAAHFEVRQDNVRVWEYHERLSAERIRQDDDNFYYSISETAIRAFLARYSSRTPNGVEIVW